MVTDADLALNQLITSAPLRMSASFKTDGPTTEMEARPGVTLAALLTLRAYGRVPG
jgi:hypothetical protein